MRNLILGLLTMVPLAASLAACGGGSAKSDASAGIDGRITVDTGPTFDGTTAGDFISGDVDGVPVRVETDIRAGTSGLSDGSIWLTAGTTSTDAWNVYVPNSVGTASCGTGSIWVALFPAAGPVLRSDKGGSCSVTVTRAAPALGDIVEGTFTAMLNTETASPPQSAVVTNGAFHVTRNFQ